MQILKTFLLAAVLPVSLLPLRSEAQETEAQAKARVALEQKMEELNRQQQAAPAKSQAKPSAAPTEAVYTPYTPPGVAGPGRCRTRPSVARSRTAAASGPDARRAAI